MAEYRPATTGPLRFGVFEVEPSARELRKHGVRIKLQDQPFAVLLILLENPGHLVTKEELQQRLWPADTFVEFDKGIYNAMKRLRETLGDEAETPRYIETLPRRGYRFIAPVQRRDGVGERLELPLTPESTPRSNGIKRLALLASLFCVLVPGVIFISAKLRSSPPVPKVVDTAQITTDGLHKDVTLRLLSDGTRLYFQEGAFVGPKSTVAPGFVQSAALVHVSTEGGETAQIPLGLGDALIYDIAPTRSELLVGGPASPPLKRPLWVVPLPTGSPRRVSDILALDACWSPDGNHLVFVGGENPKGLFVANRDGSNIRKLVALDRIPYWIRFSPDGTRLRFTVFSNSGRPEDWDIMEMAANGSGLHYLPIHGCCGKWSADGKYYFYQTSRDIWVLPERRTILGGAEIGTPAQLTTGPITFGAPTPHCGRKAAICGRR